VSRLLATDDITEYFIHMLKFMYTKGILENNYIIMIWLVAVDLKHVCEVQVMADLALWQLMMVNV
jgi:hypothetical protein